MSLITANYADTPSAPLGHAVLFHVMWVENISRSRLNQLDEWREHVDPNNASADRLKKNKVIREVNMDDQDSSGPPEGSCIVYKLLLRDNANNFTYAYEQEPLPFLRRETTGTPMPIKLGGRILVKQGTQILRGALLLNHKNCEYKGIHPGDGGLVATLNEGVAARAIDLLSSSMTSTVASTVASNPPR
ncbi:uncharacterized protein LODBEIA_P35060 [Lodderomyces beijingensis]|uniref:RecQ mediated genome instability protein 1 OB-fold domain-containing protein n=1 Tax=Lodderomyces beijingensis TaxID=1775926 RepID=A0ABP0ZMB5_9ASCO